MTSPPDNRSSHLQDRIAALSPEKQALLAKLLQASSTDSTVQKTPQIVPRSPHAAIPLSLAQERLWFLQQISPADPAYNIALTWTFTGDLNLDWFQQSFEAVVQRHEVLRTQIESIEGKAVVQASTELPPQVQHQQLTIGTLQERRSQAEAIGLADAAKPFDLTQTPLFRGTLVQTDAQEWQFFLTVHHLIADGWSRGVLLQEVTAGYRQLATGGTIDADPLPIQYGDYAIWQRSWLQSNAVKAAHTYWQKQLQNLTPIELPTDVMRSAHLGTNSSTLPAATVSIEWDESLLNQLQSFSRQMQVTLFTTLFTGFQTLLHRYTQQTDIAIGIPVANREQPELRNLIGFFVNTLVLRGQVTGEASFRTGLQQAQRTIAEGFEHQSYPFSQVVEQHQPTRDLQQNPLFQVMFQFQNEAYQSQNAATLDLKLPNLTVQQTWRELGSTKFDLTCHGIERSQSLLWVIEYRTAKFSSAFIAGLLQHFETLLQSAIAHPDRPVSQLTYLSDIERQQVLHWSTGTTSDLTKTQTQSGSRLLDRLTEQSKENPNAIALCCGNRSITYGELVTQSDALAANLAIRIAPRPPILGEQDLEKKEIIVGLYLPRSIELMVAIVAVWKVGAAYLPLDANLPAQRLHYIVSDAVPAVVVTIDRLISALPTQIPILNLSQTDEHDSENPQNCGLGANLTDRLAYIIYTSGSTGQPKGTLLTHQGLNNYLNWCVSAYPVDRGSGAPVQSAIGFDATITSLFVPLLVGKTVEMLPEGDDLAALQAILNSPVPFSFAKVTPAHLEILAKLPAITYPHAFIIGGEALAPAIVQRWQTLAPATQLINEYGPTETVVGCCTYNASADSNIIQTLGHLSGIPIGRPIPNVQLYVLDNALQLLPPGIPGELYIGGVGVARGYLNRAELTAERFIPNPFGSGTLYRTGDRVVWGRDGNLDYLGRFDFQVKLRGYRIELGEIETALRQHPNIDQAIVTLQDLPRPTLVTYFTLKNPQLILSSEDGRAFLKSTLPSYMIPNLWQSIEEIPLTMNGKVDRQALAKIAIVIPTHSSATLAPADAADQNVEATLIEIWSGLLKKTVGRSDNFFELGGDSILSLQAIAQAQNTGIYLTPQQWFEHQTIAALAQVATRANPSPPATITLGEVPLTPIQHWLFSQNLHNPNHYNQAIDLQVIARLDADWLEAALQQLRSHHAALRLRFEPDLLNPSQWRQIQTDENSDRILQVTDLSHLASLQQQEHIQSSCEIQQASLDLRQGITFRAHLFRLGTCDRLILTLHHLIVDGMSWRILLADLNHLYQQFKTDRPLQLLAPTTPFQTWAQQTQQWATSLATQPDLAHWLALNSPPKPTLKSKSLIATEKHYSITLDEPTTMALLTLTQTDRQHLKLEDLLLSAIVQSWTTLNNQSEVQIDLEHLGRKNLNGFSGDWSRTVGWFTTLYPVRFTRSQRFSDNLSDTLQTIRSQLRQVPHHGMSYGLLRYIHPENSDRLRAIQPSPISFNYLGQLDIALPEFCTGWNFDSPGLLQDHRNVRSHPIKINAYLRDQKLQMRWSYGQDSQESVTISKCAEMTVAALNEFIQYCQQNKMAGLSSSDFIGAKLDQPELNRFLRKIKAF